MSKVRLPSGIVGKLEPRQIEMLRSFMQRKRRYWHSTACIYTINTGRYEGSRILLDNRGKRMGCDVLYFTDDKALFPRCISLGLIPIYVDPKGNSPKLVQRTIKTSPHLFLPAKYDLSIYVDGNIELFASTGMILRSIDLRRSRLACFSHPVRGGVADEAAVIIQNRLESSANVQGILDMMEQSGFPDTSGLTETNILVRRHKEIVAFSNEWTQCIKKCRRDQMSFDYLLWKHKLRHIRYPWGVKPGVSHTHINGAGRCVS